MHNPSEEPIIVPLDDPNVPESLVPIPSAADSQQTNEAPEDPKARYVRDVLAISARVITAAGESGVPLFMQYQGIIAGAQGVALAVVNNTDPDVVKDLASVLAGQMATLHGFWSKVSHGATVEEALKDGIGQQ